MKIIVIDDEKMILEDMCDTVREAIPNAQVYSANTYIEALEIADNIDLDIAFSDIEMPGINGIELAKQLRIKLPRINIIFVTAYSEYAIDALSMYVSGYVLKPVTVEMVKREIENLRIPVDENKDSRLTVKCFGNFEVFKDGKLLAFERNKTKELLAYLVDRRGSAISAAELCAVLWEDEAETSGNKKIYLQKLKKDLTDTLNKVGEGDVFITSYNRYSINPDLIKCDYYEYLKNDEKAIKSYNDQYMVQYSWAEFTTGLLSNI